MNILKPLRAAGLLMFLIFIGFTSYGQSYKRIISLSGAITEVVDALGLGEQLVATDITSDYPAYINKIPKVSRNRSVGIESISSFRPDVVLALEGELSPELQQQLKALKIPFFLFKQDFSKNGLFSFIKAVAKGLNRVEEGNKLVAKVSKELGGIRKVAAASQQKILFIYARGAGYMSVSGQGTSIDAVIKDAGHQNAMKGFEGFKTYNTEALVAANPDVILLFEFGKSSLGGDEGILKMPGVKLTNAGKNNKIVSMDATLLNNYSVRLAQAISQLQQLVR